ncbi:disease resistance protein Pik-2-like isoform X2 [Aegilops tauschii subsp. strangulata]|uniref:disease resistance protein Pik-2 isoform X2 n=1 Tax=Aegilops tauschii subsp. strangulata TaxID=200361 RepID=UPI001ABD41FE|nr:disease resistance protein Pik-2 isoform X2 [Aegilops tauschii subsp. strangulata]XP_045088466.1 disease resistance protein Pik-2-like isoform X2 [Aegilops tauschii subsp. strangulata]
MDVVTSVMGSLLAKLGELLLAEYKLQKGVKEDVESLELEMKGVHAALTMVAKVPRDQLDQQIKIWADELTGLSYDMEDVVDNFLVYVEGFDPAANSHKLKLLVEKMTSLFTNGKARHQIGNAIKDIKTHAKDLADWHDRYNKVKDTSINNTVYPCLAALYKNQKDLVGIEDARDELTKRLTPPGEGDASNQPLKIVSIVGPGGLGKTTLAKAVYDSLQTQFKCKAFVPVGRNPNVSKVLKGILLELEPSKSMGDIDKLDEIQLINKLRHLLQDKRYFIVIDDIWDTTAWEIIKFALLDNNLGSRVITTTRLHQVATKTGDVYKLEPLPHNLSEELFYKILSDGKGKCPYDQPSEVSKKFLQKCAGVPLAIIAIASLLRDKPMENWSTLYSSIGFGNGDNKDIDDMRRILMFSYDDLPYHLRPCLLHLSIFPEDALIMKDTLIWMWVAEGFVHEEPGIGLFEIGERYFNDLVNRSMLLPVERKQDNAIDACRVHDMVLDIICLLSKEQNFVTILDSNGKYSSSQSKARRLAVQTRDEEQHNHLVNKSMPKLRSCYASMCHISMMPSLSCFQVLRVLDMKNCKFLENCHLEHLGKSHLLRYLSLENTNISELPKDIGDLKFLQTLDLRNCKIKGLPQSTSLLRKLKCLRVGSDLWCNHRIEHIDIEAPNWIGNLTSLEELSLKISGEFSTFVEGLGKLTELRVLDCHLRGGLDDRSKKTFVGSVCKLKKIQILHLEGLYGWSELEADTYWAGYKPPRGLRDLSMSSTFSRLPAWINSSQLPNLSKLKLDLYHFEEPDVVNLGGLPKLCDMGSLWIDSYIEFPDGAFPKLSTLVNLPSLRWVFANIDCHGARASDVEKMEAAVRQAIDNHPNHPTLDLDMSGDPRMIKEPASPLLHHTTSVGTSAQEDQGSSSQQTKQEFHDDDDNRVRQEPDPEQKNQDQSHEGQASDSSKADQMPDDEREANDVDVDAAEKCSVLDVHPSGPVSCLSFGMSAPPPARTTATGVGSSAQAINEKEEEEEESQADRQEEPAAEEHQEAEDGSAETTPPETLHTVVATSLAESSEAAAATPAPPVPARPRWRPWACFSCLKSGSSSSH